jgi:hypothetical protein
MEAGEEDEPPVVLSFLGGVVPTQASGGPGAGARVSAAVAASDCQSNVRSLGTAEPSDTAGRYRAVLSNPGLVAGECLQAVAKPPGGSALGASAPERFAVTFAFALRDSTRLDLRLRAP